MTQPVQILEGGSAALHLAQALLLYRSSQGHVYVTAHPVEPHPVIENARMIGAGSPASKEALADFAAAVTTATAFTGMVPANLLYTGPNIIAWWRPASRRRVWFKCDDEEIGTASADIMHPPLIFVATANSWFVYATKSQDRPTEKTVLYKAPYFNVWVQGKICTGNVDLPEAIGPEAIPAYEDAFFRSRFTHPNDPALVKYKGGATALWRDQLQRPDHPLLSNHLVSRKETFEQAIQRILGGNK